MVDRVVTRDTAPIAQDDVEYKEDRAQVADEDIDRQSMVDDPIEQRKAAFDTEQKARAQNFEREHNATITRMQRDHDFAEQKAERDEKFAERQQELSDMSFAHGLITHDGVLKQRDLLAPHAQQGVLLPNAALAPGEETILMAFPRTVILTLSANDVKRITKAGVESEDYGQGTNAHGTRVLFYQGYNDVPVGLADHGYLYDAGAYRADDDGKPEGADERTKRLRAQDERTAQGASQGRGADPAVGEAVDTGEI